MLGEPVAFPWRKLLSTDLFISKTVIVGLKDEMRIYKHINITAKANYNYPADGLIHIT